MSKTLILLIVTFGLVFVIFASLAAGLNFTLRSVAAPLKGMALPTVGVLVANFAVVPLLTGLTLHAFHFAAQATMAFALLSVVAGAPFVPCSPGWAAVMWPTRQACPSS